MYCTATNDSSEHFQSIKSSSLKHITNSPMLILRKKYLGNAMECPNPPLTREYSVLWAMNLSIE